MATLRRIAAAVFSPCERASNGGAETKAGALPAAEAGAEDGEGGHPCGGGT